MISRRSLFKGAAACWALHAVNRAFAQPANPLVAKSTPARPRYFVQIILAGGIDAVYGMDPKTRKDLEPAYDAPIVAKQIRAGTGEVTLGPHLHALLPWVDRLSVVRGVSTSSVAHIPAIASLYGGKRGFDASLGNPSLSELFGTTREPEQICGAALLGDSPQVAISTGMLQDYTLKALIDEKPDELLISAEFLAKRRAKLLRNVMRLDERVKTTAETLATSERLLRRMAELPRPKPATTEEENRLSWQKKNVPAPMRGSQSMLNAFWLLKNDLCKSVVVFQREWDSHVENAEQQTMNSLSFFEDVHNLFKKMEAERINGVSMLDQTLVFIGSELGRFPIINNMNGKHHFPENAFIMMGPGIQQGKVFGATGRDAQGVAMDLRTGKPDRAGKKPNLDDLVATLLTSAGFNPPEHGFYGERLGLLS
jgi:uncharacterized protein (DUF1501 family)